MSQASWPDVVFASSMMLVKMLIGTCVEVPLSTEKLLPRRTLFTVCLVRVMDDYLSHTLMQFEHMFYNANKWHANQRSISSTPSS